MGENQNSYNSFHSKWKENETVPLLVVFCAESLKEVCNLIQNNNCVSNNVSTLPNKSSHLNYKKFVLLTNIFLRYFTAILMSSGHHFLSR